MATYKRRIVYLSDEEWRMVGQLAESHGRTISGHIRACLRNWQSTAYLGDDLPAAILAAENLANFGESIRDVGQAVDRAYAEVRPVPKPSHKPR